MDHSRLNCTILAALAITLFISLPAISQEYLQEELKFKKLSDDTNMDCWIPTSDNSGLLFLQEFDEKNIDYYTYSVVINKSGKTKRPVKIIDTTFVQRDMDGVWLWNDTGKLFSLYYNLDYILVLGSTGFDNQGKITEWVEHKHFDPDVRYYNNYMTVAKGPDTIAVAVANAYMLNDRRKCDVWFMEFDNKGNPLGEPLQLELKNNGENQKVEVFKPIFNGNWNIPAGNTIFQDGTGYTSSTSNELLLFTLKKRKNGWKVKRRTLYNDGQPIMQGAYRGMSEVTPDDSPLLAEKPWNFKLFYIHFNRLDKDTNDVLFKNDYRIIEVSPTGKILDEVEIKIPDHSPSFNYTIPLSNQLDRVSDVLQYSPGADSKKIFKYCYLAQARSFFDYNDSTKKYDAEVQMDLWRINIKNGRVKKVATHNKVSNAYAGAPIISWWGSDLSLISEFRQGTAYSHFLSLFNP
jgi:hypothetical protein